MKFIFAFLITTTFFSCFSSKFILSDYNLAVPDSKENPFIGRYINTNSLDNGIYNIILYKSYIVFEIANKDSLLFEIYHNESSINYSNYRGKIPIFSKSAEKFFCGIYDKYLFIDCGTSNGIRGLEIIDLSNLELIYSGIWNSKKIIIVDENNVILPKFKNEYIIRKNKSETEFILHLFLFNLKTKELIDLNKTEHIISN